MKQIHDCAIDIWNRFTIVNLFLHLNLYLYLYLYLFWFTQIPPLKRWTMPVDCESSSTFIFTSYLYLCPHPARNTGWGRLIGCLKLQVIFRKRATNYRALVRKMTYEDKASCDSTPPCTQQSPHYQGESYVLIVCIYINFFIFYWNLHLHLYLCLSNHAHEFLCSKDASYVLIVCLFLFLYLSISSSRAYFTWPKTHLYVPWLIDMHYAFKYVPWLIHMCQDSLECVMT